MPSGNKRRPDTLELEVFGSPRGPRHTETLNVVGGDAAGGQKSRLSAVASSSQPETIEKPATRRWFHFRERRPGKPAEAGLPASTSDATSTANSTFNGIATDATAKATAARSSPTSRASTHPPSNNHNAPEVVAVRASRRNSKKRRRSKTQTESLYSIATLAQSGEVQLQQRSEPNVHNDFEDVTWARAPTRPTSDAGDAPIFVEKSADDLLLTQAESAAGVKASERPSSGLWSNFMSVLGKVTVWKRSNCRRSSSTAKSIGDGFKSRTASSDFEHFSVTSAASEFASGRPSKGGVRGFSTARRRRSSYYFSDNERRIRANDREFNSQFKYADNYIKTSKYSLLTFLPFNLLEQFQRLANFYFLCLLVLQLIPAISSLTPVTTAIPLIGVLTLTAVKDAYDDIQRHLSDSQVNNRRSKTLRNGKLVDEKWSGVQVGDVIRLDNNQFVAADILLLTTSEPNGLCFIETAELDGETNLKCKQCLSETTDLGQQHDLLWHFNGEIICERPNNLLNKFEGTLMWNNQRFALDNEKILLRGCVLRNTQWCYGVVIFAGKDTKLMQNSGKTQFKSTGVDRLLNFIIIGIVLFLLSICAFFTLACAIWEYLIGQHFQVYLPWEHIIPKSVPQGATVIGLLVFFSYAIVLNTVVPISLYVSVEVIRFAQSFLINWDEDMYYEKSKTPAKARTTTLNEELGQIQYIFSDKTGTLTQNIMTFNKCSINGRAYGDVIDLRTGEVIEVTDKQILQNSKNKSTAPTIFLHSAEVYPKSELVVSTPTDEDREETAPTTVTPLASSTLTTPTDPPSTLPGGVPSFSRFPPVDSLPRDASSENVNNIHGTKVKTKRLHYADEVSSTSTAPTPTPGPVRQQSVADLSPRSQRRRLTRQRSAQSNASEKVMFLGVKPRKTAQIVPNLNTITKCSSRNCIHTIETIDTNTAASLTPQTTSPTTSTAPTQPHQSSANSTEVTHTTPPSANPNKVSFCPNNKCTAEFCTPFCCCSTNTNTNCTKSSKLNRKKSTVSNTNTTTTTNSISTKSITTRITTSPMSDSVFNTDTFTTNWRSTHQKVHALTPVDFSANPEYEPEFHWYDHTLLEAVRSDDRHTHNFFRLLALCHTVMPEYVDGRLEYQAQSPDEAALVSAARNFGFVFRSRTPNSITIEVMGRTEEYELLSILDFNNVRKRMSVILRRNNRIILYCKGADNVIYDRLDYSQSEMKAHTQEHLNKFAGEGLRTLALAERQLDLNYFDGWRDRQREASLTMDGRDDKLNELYEEIESNMQLVGVTAIEDKLQDGVPQTIANLQMAGIKIWVLTGDKQETAINIGYSCQLLTDELFDVFIVDGCSMDEVEKQLRQFKESIRIVNRYRPTPLEPAVDLHLNGSHPDSASVINRSSLRTPVQTLPPAPAISVVTFRWEEDRIKHNKGEPDSAECNELYNNFEKDSKGSQPSTPSSDEDVLHENTGFALVINGHSLVHCLSPVLEARFLDIASQCKAVICCRVTPLQKALVVELIKRAKKAVTLAIGDGANDVSMIKAAHIGVGISGQEGLQAVLASDYSIAQFRYLERLLLVHGRWSYYRMCKFLRYFFYKNFAFTLCHCWFSFFCGFSAQTVFDPMFISVYNLFYTSLPVLALGVFEQDVSDKHSVEYPKLYTPGLKSQLFNTKEFVFSVLHGVFSSLVLFLIPYGTYKDGLAPNGFILSDHMTLGAVVATILIIDNTAQIALYTSYWTIVNHIMIWGSLVWYFILDYFYNYVIGGPYVGSLTQAMKDLTFWATMFITVTVIMLPVLAYKFYLSVVCPKLSDKIRMKQRQATIRSRQTTHVMRTPSSRRARRSLRSGYAFAHQEGFGRLITSGKIMRKLPQEFAFPLGLGSKKTQSTSAPVESSISNQHSNNNSHNNNNNNNFNYKENGKGYTNGVKRNDDSRSNVPGSNDDDSSPRAPCQDLDTINL